MKHNGDDYCFGVNPKKVNITSSVSSASKFACCVAVIPDRISDKISYQGLTTNIASLLLRKVNWFRFSLVSWVNKGKKLRSRLFPRCKFLFRKCYYNTYLFSYEPTQCILQCLDRKPEQNRESCFCIVFRGRCDRHSDALLWSAQFSIVMLRSFPIWSSFLIVLSIN